MGSHTYVQKLPGGAAAEDAMGLQSFGGCHQYQWNSACGQQDEKRVHAGRQTITLNTTVIADMNNVRHRPLGHTDESANTFRWYNCDINYAEMRYCGSCAQSLLLALERGGQAERAKQA